MLKEIGKIKRVRLKGKKLEFLDYPPCNPTPPIVFNFDTQDCNPKGLSFSTIFDATISEH